MFDRGGIREGEEVGEKKIPTVAAAAAMFVLMSFQKHDAFCVLLPPPPPTTTGRPDRTSHRKWRETKQQLI